MDVPCRACGRPVAEGSARCPHCRVALGEQHRCPHCGAIAEAERSATLRFTCAVCGAPVVPVDAPFARAHPEAPALARARRASLASTAWLVAAAFAATFGAVSLVVLGVVAIVAHPPLLALALAGLAVAVPFLFAGMGLGRAARQSRAARDALDAGWAAAAAELARARGGSLDAATLARVTGIDEATADQVLGRVQVDALLRTEEPPRVRVAPVGEAAEADADAASRRGGAERPP